MALLLVDGDNLLMRAAKATERTDLTSDEGEPTAALVAFCGQVGRFIASIDMGRMVVCWDRGHDLRTSLYPEYKGNRHERPESQHVTDAFVLARGMLSAADIPQIAVDGFEADDLIAYYARLNGESLGSEVAILSADRDLLQLVSDQVTQIRPGVDPEHWGPDQVLGKFGCTPEQYPLVKALMGDKGDNVPGVPGIGEKRAVKHLSSNEWDLEKTIREVPKLTEYGEQIRMALDLVDLRTPNPHLPDLPDVDLYAPDYRALASFFDSLNMKMAADQARMESFWASAQLAFGRRLSHAKG